MVLLADSNGGAKDGGGGIYSLRPPAPRSFPGKLVRPALLFAVLATGLFLLLVLGGGGGGYGAAAASSYYYRLPRRLSVPDAGIPPPCSARHDQDSDDSPERWWARPAARSAWHNMSDEELLWAASFEPRRYPPPWPHKPKPKVAFMFLTRGPLPLAPLWERFFSGAGRELFSVYVHATPGYRLDFPPSSPFHRRQVPSKAARWGDPSIVDAEQRLLANALLDITNAHFVLLSESCIPLHPFPAIHHYLTRSRHSFVGAFDDPGPHGRGRYPAALAPDIASSQWRKGAQWFTLRRDLAVFFVSDGAYYPKFRRLCRPPCYVDEHYLPTVLSAVAPRGIANRTVTWVDWSRGGAHPATFGAADVGAAFLEGLTGKKKKKKESCMYNGQPAEVCFLFARKFAPSALPPLLRLSPELLGY